MIDTHTHIYFSENFGDDIEEVINRATSAGISHFILPNVDSDSILEMRKLHNNYPDLTTMAIGYHPTEIDNSWEGNIKKIEDELRTGDYKAVGEVGIDLFWDKTFINSQIDAFEVQLHLADSYNLPVIIHSREALKETVETIRRVVPSVPLIFHSFTGSKEDVKEIRKICDPYFGINGVVTYKNAQNLRDSLEEITLGRLLLETDSPYLSPVPFRGKRNETFFLKFIRDKIAEVMNQSSNKIEEITDFNAKKIFRI